MLDAKDSSQKDPDSGKNRTPDASELLVLCNKLRVSFAKFADALERHEMNVQLAMLHEQATRGIY